MASGLQALHLGAPPWGNAWYKKQALAFSAQKSKPAGYVVVAWALGDGKRGYVYGLFKSMARFYEYLREMPSEKRVGFEIIQENEPCWLYLDVEWVGEADPEHDGIRRLCSLLREYCRKQHHWDTLRLYVTCGSREHKTKHKNSYHVHVNVRFENNHNKDMHAFVADFVLKMLGGDEWSWKRESGDVVHCVDMLVYTRNRLLRPPGNCKPGQKPHVRISGAPMDESDTFQSHYAFSDSESWLPCIVSGAAAGDDVYMGPKHTAPAGNSGTVRGRKRKLEPDEGGVPLEGVLPLCSNPASLLPKSVRIALLGTKSTCFPHAIKNFPTCIQKQIRYNFLCLEDIVQLQVTTPALCAPFFFRNESELHAHSSNGCLVLVVHQRHAELVQLLGKVQVYVKCFCKREPDAVFGKLGEEDNLLEIPRYKGPGARAMHVRYVVETKYGIDSVLDAEARRLVQKAYQLGWEERLAMMRKRKNEVAWEHVFACNCGWRPWPLHAQEDQTCFAPRAV